MLKYILNIKAVKIFLASPIILLFAILFLIWDYKVILDKDQWDYNNDDNQDVLNVIAAISTIPWIIILLTSICLFNYSVYANACEDAGGTVHSITGADVCYVDGTPHQIEGYKDVNLIVSEFNFPTYLEE